MRPVLCNGRAHAQLIPTSHECFVKRCNMSYGYCPIGNFLFTKV